jgi:tetratricopeptide (TPR) repeat protein
MPAPARRLLAAPVLLALLPISARLDAGQLERAIELHRAGRLAQAVEAYRSAATAAERPEAAATARSNACAALNELGRYREALEECRKAEELLRGSGGLPLADTLNNLGWALDGLGSTPEAEAAYRRALGLYQAAGRPEDEALVLSNLASLAIGRGALGEAMDWIDRAEALARGAAGEDWAEEELRIGHVNRGVVLERLGAYREALAEVREGAGPDDPETAAVRILDVAVLYRNLGDPWRALSELDRAEALLPAGSRSMRATIALDRGLVELLNLEHPARAEERFAAALELARAAGDRREEGRSLCALGRARLALRDLRAADAAFRECLRVAEASESAETRWTALAGLGRVAADDGRAEEALSDFRAAIEGIEAVGSGVASAGLREGLIADQREVYADAVDLLAGRGAEGSSEAAAEALALSERARARELLDTLAGGAPTPALDAPGLLRAGRELGPLLVYFAGRRTLWRFRLDASGVTVSATGTADSILASARSAAADLAAGRTPQPPRLSDLAHALLPDPLPSGSPLTVVPDGALFYLPFELLPTDRSERRLLDEVALRYSPSVSVLARLPTAPAAPRWTFAALADPTANAEPPGGPAGLLAARFGLAPLPGALHEARAAARSLGGEVALVSGPAASETAYRRLAGEGARVLLLAAHTLVDERLRGGAAVFLAPDREREGILTPAEIAATPIEADLAVLSGCATALAGRRDGRSMATLSGAFLGAGARGVVATLWAVGDRAAEALMVQFFDQLARGVEPAEALRRAKSKLAHDPRWRGRTDWSAFVLLGRPAPLPARRSALPWTVLAALAVAGAAIAALRARRAAG